jgi:hypothetical protein
VKKSKWIVPTDADAARLPRRPCRVRNSESDNWMPAQLLAVVNGYVWAFLVLRNGYFDVCEYCEIEKSTPRKIMGGSKKKRKEDLWLFPELRR